jgi:hypothetical protein
MNETVAATAAGVDAMHIGLHMFVTEYAVRLPSTDRDAVPPRLDRDAPLRVR